MEIKDKCFKYCQFDKANGTCSKTGKEPPKDSSSCEMYQEKDDSPVHGWLAFFCFAIGLGSLLTFIYSLNTDIQDYSGSFWLKASDVSLGAIGLLIAAYTIYAIIKRKNNAVFFAKAYMVMVFVTNLIVLLLNLTDESSYMTSLRRTISSLIWGIIWILYLIFSNQVNERFPKEKRMVGVKEWLAALSMIYIPFFCIIIFWIGGDSTKYNLRELARELNYEMRFEDGIDSVTYNEKDNVLSYYYQCDDESIELISSREENDLKIVLLSGLQEDEDSYEFLNLLKKGKATLRYVYQSSGYGILKVVSFTPAELKKNVNIDLAKESALRLIENEAKESDAECPVVIADGIIWSGCTFDKDRACMTFTYTLTFNKQDIDRDVLDEILDEDKSNMVESIIGNSIYKMASLSIVIEYRDINNELIDNAVIGPHDY